MENSTTKRVTETSKRDRYLESDDSIVEKKQKTDNIVSLQLVDLNDDCLQLIFEHLTVSHLVNVAETSDRFIPAAQSVFSRYHRQKTVSLWFSEKQSKDEIVIRITMAAAFFRHFGHFVSKLSLYHLSFIDPEGIVLQSILQQCATSFVQLALNLFEESDFEVINQPFESVEHLILNMCLLDLNWFPLGTLFPNLKSLALNHNSLNPLQSQCFATHLPRLEHLKIDDQRDILPLATIREMLHLNPQLQSLVLNRNYDVDFLQSINDFLPQLKELEICVPNDGFISFGDQKVQFKNVQKFKLTGKYFNTLGAVYITHMPFAFTKVGEFELVNVIRVGDN